MAKGKHATALFEVMNKTRFAGGRTGSTGGGGGGIPTPKWWFKSRNGGDGKSLLSPDEAPQAEAEAAPYVEEALPPRPAPVIMPPLASSVEVPDVNPAVAAPRAQPDLGELGRVVAVSVDPDRQQISLRLSYTSALIGGFGIFIALALAVLIGKGLRRNESSGVNDTVEGSAPRPANATSTGTRSPQPSFNDPRPPATFFTDGADRQSGLNYAIIQSYPDKDTAQKAAEFLTKNGIPCTVERNLPNWRLAWPDGSVVVGIRGFAKVNNNPALDAYKKSIMDVSLKFTNGRSRFAGFSPTMYLWRKSN